MSISALRRSLPHRVLALVAVGLLFLPSAQAAEEKNELKTFLIPLPPGFFFLPDSSSDDNSQAPQKAPVLVKDNPFYPGHNIYDVGKFLQFVGINPAKGAQALYNKSTGVLFVKDSVANLKRLQEVTDGGCDLQPTSLRNEISVIELAPSSRPPNSPAPSLAKLKKAAGKSWRPVCMLELASKSGSLARGATMAEETLPEPPASATATSAPILGATKSGMSCIIETIIGPDGTAVDSTVSLRYHNLKSSPPQIISYEGSCSSREGRSQLLQYIAGNGTGPAYAIVLRVTIVTAYRDTAEQKQR